MAKVEIDNKKMLESLRKAMWYFPEAEWLTRSIDTALSEQGLTVNDKGEIITIESEPKKCLFTKDLYTDEERKELCEGCQEECELNKDIEPKERKVSSVLKNMLDNINEESLEKTREEMQKTPEIAEFDKAIETLIGNIDGDYCVHISSYDDYINKFAPKILAAARKLIASEIDATQMTRELRIKELHSLTLGAAYYQGIVNTIKKIKGE